MNNPALKAAERICIEFCWKQSAAPDAAEIIQAELIAAIDERIDAAVREYNNEDDPEWKRNNGFRIEGMRAIRRLIYNEANVF